MWLGLLWYVFFFHSPFYDFIFYVSILSPLAISQLVPFFPFLSSTAPIPSLLTLPLFPLPLFHPTSSAYLHFNPPNYPQPHSNNPQISLGDQSNYYLSTARNDLGVLMATSDAGNAMHPVSWREYRDPVTGTSELRKVAKPF